VHSNAGLPSPEPLLIVNSVVAKEKVIIAAEEQTARVDTRTKNPAEEMVETKNSVEHFVEAKENLSREMIGRASLETKEEPQEVVQVEDILEYARNRRERLTAMLLTDTAMTLTDTKSISRANGLRYSMATTAKVGPSQRRRENKSLCVRRHGGANLPRSPRSSLQVPILTSFRQTTRIIEMEQPLRTRTMLEESTSPSRHARVLERLITMSSTHQE
jgi:hypothetical protein